MKHMPYRLKPNRSIVVLLIIFAILITTSVVVFINRDHTEASSAKSYTNEAVQSRFSFDAAEAPGWFRGPTNATSMAIFSSDNSCWVSFDSKDGVLNEAAELQKSLAVLTDGGYNFEQKDALQLALASSSGNKPYKLYQHSVSGAGSAGQLYGGQQIGYVQFPDSYVLIHVYCNTFDQLSTAQPVLQAIKFDDTK